MSKPLAKALDVYFIAGTQDLRHDRDLPTLLTQGIKAGITMFQYREKGPKSLQEPQEIEAMARQLQRICHAHAVPFIINDDVDLALTLQADGIHVGQGDLNIAEVIATVPKEMLIGLSCHSLREVIAANRLPELSYYGIGPVFATSSKSDAQSPLGIQQLHDLADFARKPVVGIGGLTLSNSQGIDRQNIPGLAVISAITQGQDLPAVIEQLKK